MGVGELAPALWGIPVVSGSSERAALFPAPSTNQRVQNLTSGYIERYTGAAWRPEGITYLSGPLISVRAKGAAGDGVAGTPATGTDDTAAFQAAIDAVPDYGCVFLDPGVTYRITGAPSLNGRKGITFVGWGATIQLSGVSAQAFRFSGGVNDDTTFLGIRVVGSGVLGDDHSGFGTIVGVPNGTAGSRIRYVNCHVKDCVRGFHMETSDLIWRDVSLYGCRVENIVGTASGKGYGMCLASLVGVKVQACYFDLCQRHSLYCANSQDVNISGNTFRRHRSGVATGAQFPALVVARRPNVAVLGNSFDTCADVALSIESDESDTAQRTNNVQVIGNHFHGSTVQDIVVGNSGGATSGEISGVVIMGNAIVRTEAATSGSESIRVHHGKRITIAFNDFWAENAYTVTKTLIVIGNSGIAASFLSRVRVYGNTASVTMNGFSAYLCEVATTIATGTSRVTIAENEIEIGAASGGIVLYDATRTNTNIRVYGNSHADSQSSVIGATDRFEQEDINATGGYRQSIDCWVQDNVAASQTNAIMARWSCAGTAFATQWVAPRPGSVTAIVVKSNAARAAGTLTVTVFKNSVSTGLSAVLDGTNTTTKATTQAKDVSTFAAGDVLDVRITTDGSWSPTTADIAVSIEVET